MNKISAILTITIGLLSSTITGEEGRSKKQTAQHLQDISVTIKAESGYSKSEGSGVLISRQIEGEGVTFVWTAAHVVDNLRNVRTVVDESGSSVKIIEFDDAQIVKELVEGGRRVGEMKMDARVIKYSDADHGQDLALLMVRAKNYGKAGAKFYTNEDEDIIPIGTQLFHVGSLLGQMGANSMTSGIVSQVGRVEGKVEFDQTTVTAFPGSSGGGVYLTNGTYIGMLVRGAGENFNLIVPIRRMSKWAKSNGLLWALDAKQKMPTFEDIENISIESSGIKARKNSKEKSVFEKEFPFLIKITTTKPDESEPIQAK
jgi:S1-C subfamily serine protease